MSENIDLHSSASSVYLGCGEINNYKKELGG